MAQLFRLLVLLLAASPALATQCLLPVGDLAERPMAGNAPTEVDIKIYVNDVISIKDADQSFVADVIFRASWNDPRLAHDGRMPCTLAPEQVWTPALQLLNRRAVENIRQPELMVAPDGTVVLLLRSLGEFSFRADLSDFPFDSQQLSFKIVSAYGEDLVRLVTDDTLLGLSEDLSVANWHIEIAGFNNRVEYVAPVDRKLARLDVILRAERLTGYYTWQQMVPLFLVVMMTWVVFWIPLEFLPPRVGLAATAMLTLIAYRFAMSSVLPPIAYLTRLDVFMIGASVLVFAALATTVGVSYIVAHGNEQLAGKVNRSARWLSPLLLVLVAIGAFYS